MFPMFDPATVIGRSGADSAMKLGSCTMGSFERLMRLQVDAVNEMVNENNENLKLIFSKPGPTGLLEYWQSTYQANLERTMELGRRYATEMTKIQSEMTQLMGELATTVNQGAFKNFEEFTKNAIEETEKA